MKRRIGSLCMALVLCLGLLPAKAQAAGDWTYYPKSDDRLYGYIQRNGLRVGVRSEAEADIGAESPYNLVIGSNGDAIPADVTELDLTGTITDSLGQGYTITEDQSTTKNDQIKVVILPDTVKRIGATAYLNAALTSINFPSSLESIGHDAFSGSALREADLSETKITTLGSSAFYHCYSLTSVQLPSTLTSIGDNAFGGCTGLTELTLPQSISQIGWSALSGSGVKNLTVEATTPPTLENYALDCPLEAIFVPKGSVTAYRTAEGWKDYAEKIWAIGETPVTYGLSVSSPEVSFGSFISGNVPEAQTVTITNTGTGEVTVQLPSSEDFTITAGVGFTGNTATIAGNGTAFFTIRPQDSAADKTVSETLTIQGTPTDSESPARPSVAVTASYTVTEKLTYTISASPETLNFGSFTAGEALPEAKTVTVSNTGTGTVEVQLPSSQKFTITAGMGFSDGKAALGKNQSATFTIQPKDVSAEGLVSETLTISATSAGASSETSTASVTVSYTVAFPKVTVGGVELRAAPDGEAAYALTDETGAVTTSGASASQYNIKWDGQTLTLRDAKIAAAGKHGIQSDDDLTLALEGSSALRIENPEGDLTSYYGIDAGKGLTITGTGSLDITADSSAIQAGALTVRDATVSVVSQNGSGMAADSMALEAGSVTARGRQYGLRVSGNLSVSTAAYLNARGDTAALETGSITIAGAPYTEKVDAVKVVIEDGQLTQTGVLYVNGVDILEDGAELPQGVSYDRDTNTLTLQDAAIENHHQIREGSNVSFYGIYSSEDLNLVLEGSSSISGCNLAAMQNFYGIAALGGLSISGTGSLDIAGASGQDETTGCGIMVLSEFTLQSGSVTITLGGCEINMGLYSGGSILVTGGTLAVKRAGTPQTTGASIGILSETSPEELNGKSAVHITGGTVSIQGNDLAIAAADVNDSSSTAITAASILVEGGTLTARGGDITVEGTGAEGDRTAAVISTGIGTEKIVIQGGTVIVQCGRITCADEKIQMIQGALSAQGAESVDDMLTISPKAPEAITVKLGADEAGAEAVTGSPFASETVLSSDALKQAAYFHSEVLASLILTADQTSLTGGGTVKLTVGGALTSVTDDSAKLTVTCSDSSIAVTGGPDVWTASLPNANQDYTFTVTYTSDAYPSGITAACTVRVTRQSHSSGGSSGTPTYSISLPGPVAGGQVELFPRYAEQGDTVTLTVTPDDGYVLDTLTVTDSQGRALQVRDRGDGEYTFTMPASRVTVDADFAKAPTALPFTDVAEDHWAVREISWALENGYMNGTSAATFHPSGTVSRQQVWMILSRMAGADPADMAAAKAWAMANGISDGTNPGGAVTRQQLAALLYRFAVQNGYDVSIGENTNLLSYTDFANLSEYAIAAMQWACGAGIINGTGDGSTLSPQGSATRAQLAVMLYRWLA